MRDRILAVLRSIRPKPIAILRFLELSLEGICAIPGYATWALPCSWDRCPFLKVAYALAPLKVFDDSYCGAFSGGLFRLPYGRDPRPTRQPQDGSKAVADDIFNAALLTDEYLNLFKTTP